MTGDNMQSKVSKKPKAIYGKNILQKSDYL